MIEANFPQTLSEGQTIQWYRVEKVLGRGGFGFTYLATDNNLDHRVAIKEYLPTALVERQADKSLAPVSSRAEQQYREGLARFLSEARTLVKFRHKNIVRVMAVFEANNTAYLVMEYEEGERFKESVSKEGGVDEHTLKSLLLDIIDGLEQVHEHGFIHRDIKPVNIIIRHDGSPVLLDFGASRVVNRDSGAPPTSFVSAGFTPLEQYQEGSGMETGPWTDIYSLAATLYYAISGQIPVSAVSRLASFVKKSPDPLTAATEVGHGKYSNDFLEAIDWALQFKTSDRPQSLAEWREAIVRTEPAGQQRTRKVRPSRRSSAPRNTAAERAIGGGSGRRWWVAGVLMVITGAGWKLYLDVQQRQTIQGLLDRADNVLTSENYLTESRPVYLDVLSLDPQNQQALDKVAEIDARTERFVASQTSKQQFDTAESTLAVYAQVQPERARVLRVELEQARVQQETQRQLEEAEADRVAGRFQNALIKLARIKESGAAVDQVAALEERVRFEIDQRAVRQETQREQEEQFERVRLENARRLAEANERQRQRRSDYRQYLNSTKWALQNDDVETARKWFDSASAMQISDAELTDLKSRLEAAEKFLQTPLSKYELSYARGQFNALERAVELKNIAAIEELVGSDSPRINLFRTLFERYRQITVRVFDVEPKLDPKRVTAVLRIEKMALPNGDVVYPAASYRDSELSIERQRYTWSPIQW